MTVDETDIFPWYLLHYIPGNAVEVEDDNNGLVRLKEVGADEEDCRQMTVSVENDFMSLTPGESILITEGLRFVGKGILFEVGERFRYFFRGTHRYW